MIFGWPTFNIMCDNPTLNFHPRGLALLLEISLNNNKKNKSVEIYIYKYI
jgi:hypothetical protein